MPEDTPLAVLSTLKRAWLGFAPWTSSCETSPRTVSVSTIPGRSESWRTPSWASCVNLLRAWSSRKTHICTRSVYRPWPSARELKWIGGGGGEGSTCSSLDCTWRLSVGVTKRKIPHIFLICSGHNSSRGFLEYCCCILGNFEHFLSLLASVWIWLLKILEIQKHSWRILNLLFSFFFATSAKPS